MGLTPTRYKAVRESACSRNFYFHYTTRPGHTFWVLGERRVERFSNGVRVRECECVRVRVRACVPRRKCALWSQ